MRHGDDDVTVAAHERRRLIAPAMRSKYAARRCSSRRSYQFLISYTTQTEQS